MMIEKVMIQLGAKTLRSSGGVGGGGSPPMEKLMIQLGARNLKTSEGAKDLKSSGGVGGGGSTPTPPQSSLAHARTNSS